MMGELFKCFLAGFAGFASLAVIGGATYIFWPHSGYAWAALFFVGVCIGAGSDMRSKAPGTGPR